MIQYILAMLFSLAISTKTIAQVDNFDHIANQWSEGEFDENGAIVNKNKRAGLYRLKIYKDHYAVFNYPYSCGAGRKKEGHWVLNPNDTTLTFNFSTETAYYTDQTVTISEIETYKILKLSKKILKIQLVDSINPIIYSYIKN